MKLSKKSIETLQGRLFESLTTLFSERDFNFNVNDKCFSNLDINLMVNTNSLEEYTIRPSITIRKDFFQDLYSIVKTQDFEIYNCGHFYVSHKLANHFDCHKYDECKENKFRFTNPLFLFCVSDEESIDEVVCRIKEMLDDFLLKFINDIVSDMALYDTYRQFILRYEEDLNQRPHVNFLERPIHLDINAYLTFVYLSQLLKIADSDYYINLFLKHARHKEYWVNPTIRIVEGFGNDTKWFSSLKS